MKKQIKKIYILCLTMGLCLPVIALANPLDPAADIDMDYSGSPSTLKVMGIIVVLFLAAAFLYYSVKKK